MSREATNALYDLVDEGVLTWEMIATAALKYMSEDEVRDMAECNEFFNLYEDGEY